MMMVRHNALGDGKTEAGAVGAGRRGEGLEDARPDDLLVAAAGIVRGEIDPEWTVKELDDGERIPPSFPARTNLTH